MIVLDTYKMELGELSETLSKANAQMKPQELQTELKELEDQMSAADFWNDIDNANKITQRVKILKDKLERLRRLNAQRDDIQTLIEMAEEEEDESLTAEIKSELADLQKKVEALRLEMLLICPYDSCNAVLSLHAGAGGTEAQDWTDILYRMYSRYCDRRGWSVKELDLLPGENAGIKSVTFEVEGENAYGYLKSENEPYTQEPEELINGTIDPSHIRQLICGYQVTALVMDDGRMYMWGNNNSMLSLAEFANKEKYNTGVQKVAFSNYYAILLKEDGTVTGGQTLTFNKQTAYSNKDGQIQNLRTYMKDRKVLDIAATNNCYCFVMDDGSMVVFGASEYGEKDIPEATANEKIVGVKAGTRHFVAVSETGNVYAWGHNDGGQCNVDGDKCRLIYTGSKQTYMVDSEDKVVESVGFKGYPLGTDSRGRDILTRIIHGGKMTMPIGAVAVVVSTIIAVIVGCLSGYFGGWVDMLLMRVTEIFSSLPFLPFAMMLSYVIRTMPIDENTRIFIIMIILGLLSWTGLARMIRAQVLAEREKEFVIAAKSMGVKENRIAFKHILPNVISIILVNITLDFAGCMLTESSLSYLGFGVQQPQPTWGNMLNGANNSIVIQNYWWQWLFPAIALSVATISINIIGDTLRDVLDPKSSQEK